MLPAGALCYARQYRIVSVGEASPDPDGSGRPVVEVDVDVEDAKGDPAGLLSEPPPVYVRHLCSLLSPAGTFRFTLVQRQMGRRAGCWLTKSVGRVRGAS